MKTILAILKQAGGWHHGMYLKIEHPPYMELVIEAMDESGPMGLPAISVCHYGYKRQLEADRRAALADLVAYDQEIGL